MNMLRDYQSEMLGRLENAWRVHRSVMVQMPTGTGKTVLLASAIRNVKRRMGAEGLVLVVAHRRELIGQIRQTIAAFGMDGDGIRVESIQKLSRQGAVCPDEACPSLVVIDEAHHATARTYRMLWQWWPGAKFLGLTATPCRLSGEAFTDLFDVLLQAADIQWFIDRGWLSDFEYISASPDSEVVKQVGALRKRGVDGDYQQKEMAMVLDTAESVARLYASYEQFAKGKKGIVYAICREHARHIMDCYQAHGVNCAMIDARTAVRERERTVAAYREGFIDVLVNVDIFSEGYDCPEVEFIQLARPTLSLSKYLQQVGRGMRISAGKEMVTVLDNAGLYLTFGFPTDSRDWRGMFLGQRDKGERSEALQMACRIAEHTVVHKEKELLRLEMVRIKGNGERKSGLSLFVEDGKYGVMMDGVVTCPARYEGIEILKDSAFYAIAMRKREDTALAGNGPAYVKTVIDKGGKDLHAEMEGVVEEVGNGFFRCREGLREVYWDVKTGCSYEGLPYVEKFGFVEGLWAGDDLFVPRVRGERFRDFRFRKDEVYYNRFLTIIRDMLIINNEPNTAYMTYGYIKNQIIVGLKRFPKRYQLVNLDGTMGRTMSKLGGNCVRKLFPGELFLGRSERRNG